MENEEGVTGRYDSDRLKEAIFKQIDYFRHEYKLTYAEVIGVISAVEFQMNVEMRGDDGKS